MGKIWSLPFIRNVTKTQHLPDLYKEGWFNYVSRAKMSTKIMQFQINVFHFAGLKSPHKNDNKIFTSTEFKWYLMYNMSIKDCRQTCL